MDLIYGICMTAAGVACFIYGRRSFKTARDSKKWPTVEGIVLESGTEVMSGFEGRAIGAKVKYEYEAGGVKYTSDRISVGQYGTGGGGHAKAEAARYPAGKKVTVYYDPKNPGQALLEPGGALLLSAFLLFFAAMLIPLGLLFFVASLIN